MNNIMSNLRALTYVLVSAFALSISAVDVANAQCRQYVYNPLVRIGDSVGGMDCVTASGPNGVLGDVTLTSGIFSRAGTLGLSATGANSVTIATNGSTRLTVNSSGDATFAGKVLIPDAYYLALLNGSSAESLLLYVNDGSAADAAVINQTNNSYLSLYTNSTEKVRITSGGNLLVGTTTDDGASKLQVSGRGTFSNYVTAPAFYDAANAAAMQIGTLFGSYPLQIVTNSTTRATFTQSSGNFLLGGASDGGYRLDVESSGTTGTARFYDQTATTGVTQVVVRAGAGQSTTKLLVFQSSAGTEIASIAGDTATFPAQISTNSFTAGSPAVSLNGVMIRSDAQYWWSSTTMPAASPDLGLARNAAGIIEVNNGSAGTYRDIIARSYVGTAVAAATLANSQFTFHLASNTELVVTARGSDGTNRSVTLTLAP